MVKRRTLRGELLSFTQTTGFHGISYTLNNRGRWEGAFWAIVCAGAAVSTAYICADAVQFWSETQVQAV